MNFGPDHGTGGTDGTGADEAHAADSREIQLFRRNAEGLFVLHDLTGREHVALESIGCELLASDVFDGVEPEPGRQLGLPV